MKHNKQPSHPIAVVRDTRKAIRHGWSNEGEFYQLNLKGVIMKTLFLTSLIILCSTIFVTESIAQNNVTIRVADQNGNLIAGSRVWYTNANVTNWQAVYNGELALLTTGVSYIFDIVPGLPHAEYDEGTIGVFCTTDSLGNKSCGRAYPDQMQRRVIQTYQGESELLFEWWRNPVTITLVDQDASFIYGSKYNITRGHGSGIISDRHNTTLLLPVTDGSVYGAMSGEILTNGGYFIDILPGYNDTIGTYKLYRREKFPVTLTTTSVAFEWSVMECPVQVVESSETPIVDFSLSFGLFGNAGVATPGTVLHLPITDESVYPTMGGDFISGFPVDFILGGIGAGTVSFEVTNALEFNPSFVTLNNNQYGLRCMQASHSIQGRVSATCTVTLSDDEVEDDDDEDADDENEHHQQGHDSTIQSNLFGVRVDVFDASNGSLIATTITDESGDFSFTDLNSGEYRVVLQTPLGYEPTSSEVLLTLCCGNNGTANFELTCSATSGTPRSVGFWKHQFTVATGGKGSAQIPSETLCGYLDIIQHHFTEQSLNPVEVYQSPLSNSCAEKLTVGKVLLNTKGSVPKIVKAKQQLFALLLNIAAGFLHQQDVISDDGATVAQAITYCDQLIDDAQGNYEIAKKIAEKLNDGETIEAGKIPLSIPNLRYKTGGQWTETPTSTLLHVNYPNPFNPTTNFGFRIADFGLVTLKVYNLLGQEVATVLNQEGMGAGEYEFPFVASHLPSGCYFYRLSVQNADGKSFSDMKLMTLLK
ncbi:MAG: T9SS type A sorting domain-containing protein [Ignavibacteriae bacterium]|nr:T9SS type A sorting domain-containing protein [Ignavibacteriota bacterium]